MAFPQFVGSSSASRDATTGTVLAPAPAGSQAGDLFLVFVWTAEGITITPADPAWQLLGTAQSPSQQMHAFWRIAQGAGDQSFSASADTGKAVDLVAYRGTSELAVRDYADSASPAGLYNSWAAPDVTAPAGDSKVLRIGGISSATGIPDTPAGYTSRVSQSYPPPGPGQGVRIADQDRSGAGGVGALTLTFSGSASSAQWLTASLIIAPANEPPNAPIPVRPVNGAALDRALPQVFKGQFSDPNTDDTPSWSRLQYRPQGTSPWTTVDREAPEVKHTIPAYTFAAGVTYGWRLATRDALGAPTNDADLVYCPEQFFTAEDKPGAPVITSHANGETFQQTETFTWSTSGQEAYQFRVLDETATVIPGLDTGQVPSTTTRQHAVTFDANNVERTVQIAVRRDGLWSDWTEITGPVSYTPPPTPAHTLTPVPAEGQIVVNITNPTPVDGEPALSYNNVWVADPGKPLERRATYLIGNQPWIYHTPVSGYRYDGTDGTRILVEAVASNGTTSWSGDPTITDPPADGFYYGGGGY